MQNHHIKIMEQILEQLQILFFGDPSLGLTYGIAPVVAGALISAGGSILGGLFGGRRKRKQAARAAAEKKRLQNELNNLENNRQPIINPYEGVEDLSSMISNPMENLAVATQAAEMQAEESDIALANTLDTLLATGAGAGGATALAQAALRSKKGISSSIEQQEVNNQKLAAQGEQAAQQQRLAEAQRLQQADVLGKEFVYGQQERRDTERMNRLQSQITGQAQQQANYEAQAAQQGAAIASAFGQVGAAVASRPD